jgi:hypothetical protein
MSQNITEAFVQQYGANVFHLAQQKGSRLQPCVRTETQKGKSQFFDYIGPTTAVKKTGRHSSTPQIDTPHGRRRVTIEDYEWADLVDDQDKIRMLNDPTSEYAMAAAWSFGRSKDDVILAEALGTAYTGETGSVAVTFPNAQRIAANDGTSFSNINLRTLRLIKKKFDQAEIDEEEERFICMTSEQFDSLLGEERVTSADYANVKALVDGKIDTFMGFKFIRSERVNVTAFSGSASPTTGAVGSGSAISGTNRGVLAWAKTGVLMSIGEDYLNKIDPRADKSYAMQVYSRMSIGATRMEESRVIEVICKEA